MTISKDFHALSSFTDVQTAYAYKQLRSNAALHRIENGTCYLSINEDVFLLKTEQNDDVFVGGLKVHSKGQPHTAEISAAIHRQNQRAIHTLDTLISHP